MLLGIECTGDIMLSKTFSVMIIFSFLSAMITGNVENVGRDFVSSLSDAVNLCISLLGMMCFWSGFMNVLHDAGAVKFVSGIFKPFLKLIYGKNSVNEETADNLTASVSANFLGLGNAAMPLGIKAVQGFEKNNKTGVATDGAIMFAVLNTVPFQLLPSTLIALRSKYGSVNPYDVIPYIWMCSVIITLFAVVVCKIMSKFWRKT